MFTLVQKRQVRKVCLTGAEALPSARLRGFVQKKLDIGLLIRGRSPPAPLYPLLSRGVQAVYTT